MSIFCLVSARWAQANGKDPVGWGFGAVFFAICDLIALNIVFGS